MDERPVAFLLDERVARVDGDDARSWLQGQLTCDVVLARSTSIYGLVLTATGHVLADVWVLDRGDHFLLRLPKLTFEAALARLDRFIVMEDVELSVTDLSVVHVLGPVPGGVPTPRLGSEGHDLVVDDVEGTFAELASRGIGRGDAATWERLRVEAGRPALGKDFGESTLPQEAGLKAAVSFVKGCYFGQEPVVMLEHRGKPPKRLVHVRLGEPIEEGSAVTDVAGNEVGRVTSSVTSNAGTVALALVKRRALEGGPVRVGGAAPVELTYVGDDAAR